MDFPGWHTIWGGVTPEPTPIPTLEGTWVLNDTLSEPDTAFNENVAFTATNTYGTIINPAGVRFVSSTSGSYLELKPSTLVYYYATNAWATGQTNNKYNKWTFPSGATASDNFITWLAANAAKQ